MAQNENNSKQGANIIHSIYYYVIIAGCVLALSIASFILLRRVLIDTALPQLRQEDAYYYGSTPTRDSLKYSVIECDAQSDKYNSSECDAQLEKAKKENEDQQVKYNAKLQAEQYVYSILTIIIAAIVASVHIVFFRPGKR